MISEDGSSLAAQQNDKRRNRISELEGTRPEEMPTELLLAIFHHAHADGQKIMRDYGRSYQIT